MESLPDKYKLEDTNQNIEFKSNKTQQKQKRNTRRTHTTRKLHIDKIQFGTYKSENTKRTNTTRTIQLAKQK